jgi:hypothetical protein
VGTEEGNPRAFNLGQNYPNPFNPSTHIRFSVGTRGHVTLAVFNLLGQQVAMLFDGIADIGKFYTTEFRGENLSSGLYIYKLQAGHYTDIKKLLLLK